jgi:hypothetical protein
LLTAVEERSYWLKLMEDINVREPKDLIWVTSFEIKSANPDGGNAAGNRPRGATPPTLLLKGLWFYNDRSEPASVVTDFIAKLKESPLYTAIDDPTQGYKRSQPNDTEWAWDFEIPLILKSFPGLPATPTSPK